MKGGVLYYRSYREHYEVLYFSAQVGEDQSFDFAIKYSLLHWVPERKACCYLCSVLQTDVLHTALRLWGNNIGMNPHAGAIAALWWEGCEDEHSEKEHIENHVEFLEFRII